jgi:DNA-binding transcriptional LysR family regulator
LLNRLEMLRIFCTAAEANSFKEAAIRLGISPQAVTRAVKELEHLVGELLFHRNTRRIHITAFGEQLAMRARETVIRMDGLFARTDRMSDTELDGIVRITAPITVGRRFLFPALSPVARKHPRITLDLRLSDLIADVIDEKIDIGVRVGFLRDSRFVARSTAKVAFFVVGSPELLARAGKPASIEDLSKVPTAALTDRSTGRAWPWPFIKGQQFIPNAPAFATDDSETECDAVLAGLAYGQIAGYLAVPHIRAGRLITVMDAFAPEPWGLFVYRPQRGPVTPRVRLVFDRIVRAFSDPKTFPVEP